MHLIPFRQDPAILKKVARLMKTVGHPSRLMIIDLLLEKGKMSVKEIHTEIDISQSNTSQHLKSLEDLSILASEREGKRVLYFIENDEIAQLIDCMHTCEDC